MHNSSTQTTRSHCALGVFGIATVLLGACGGMDESLDTGGLDTEEEALTAEGNPDPTVVTFFSESNFWGTRHRVTLAPTGPEEVTQTLTKPQIEEANLHQRISSIRLRCGDRASQITIMLSWDPWSEFATTAKTYSCDPQQTVNINLHRDEPAFADRVGSVHLVAHARAHDFFNDFARTVTGVWSTGLRSLPSSTEADGKPRIRLKSTHSFRLRQNFKLDNWACTERGAHMEFLVNMSTNGRLRVTVASTYVDSGTGDSWGCHTDMLSGLNAAATSAAQDLADGLPGLIGLIGSHPRYYFAPVGGTHDFSINGGGTPAPTSSRERLLRPARRGTVSRYGS